MTATQTALAITSTTVRPDGEVRIELSDGTYVAAGTSWEWDRPNTIGMDDDQADAAEAAAHAAGEMWITAGRYDENGDWICEVINEEFTGRFPRDLAGSVGMHDVNMGDEDDVVSAVAAALGIQA